MENVSFFLVFTIGIISIISPCILPLLPVYLSYMSGVSAQEISQSKNKKAIFKKIILNSVLFSLGFSTVLIILGTTASIVGQYLLANKVILEKISGALIILMSLFIFFRISIGWKLELNGIANRFKLLKSFILGLSFGIIWSPCSGPILVSVLVLAANTATVFEGTKLLMIYSLGLSLSFITIQIIFLTGGWKIINNPKIFKIIHYISFATLFLLGVLIISGKFNFVVGQLSILYNNLGISF